MLTFVHIFPLCSKDSCAVIAVMADGMKELKEVMPTLSSVYYRQDNAACYHCGATITCGLVLQVSIKRLFRPSGRKRTLQQKGRDHQIAYENSFKLTERHRDTRPNERRNFVFWWSAIRRCNLVWANGSYKYYSAEDTRCQSLKQHQVWKRWHSCLESIWHRSRKIHPQKQVESTIVAKCAIYYCHLSTAIKQRRKPTSPTETEDEDNQEETSPTNVDDAEGCTQTFLRHSSMQRHLDCGRHKRELERNTLLDKAALTTYAEALEGQTAGVPQLKTCTEPVSAHNDSNMKMGWALKTSGSKVRFTSTHVGYLTPKFKIGEETGQKN